MTIDYTIDEDDCLTHQLFVASKSDRIKRKRIRSKVILPLIQVALGLLYFFSERYVMATFIFSIGLLWYFIYPLWEKRQYINHYRGFIRENYSDRLEKIATLEFGNNAILTKDNGSESKVLTTELVEINEIPSTLFLRLKGGQSFILPKDKIANIDEVIVRLKELAGHLNIKYIVDPQWEWK